MKFSYTLLKEYLPEIKSKDQVVEALDFHVFEAEEGEGNTIDLSVPTNRYSDAASHIGVAREVAAVLDIDTKNIPTLGLSRDSAEPGNNLSVNVKDEKLCPRYLAEIFEGVKIGSSPERVSKVLEDCGIRPINNIVDIMNYAMIETGQPFHAFDADKISGDIIVRAAKNGEEFVSIDNEKYKLKDSDLVIADKEKVLAVAGVKGGESSAVSEKTKNIIVESASFSGISVYRTSREMGLVTDASLRFAHDITPALSEYGLNRVVELMEKELGVKSSGRLDSSPTKKTPRNVSVEIDWLNGFLGTEFSLKEIQEFLKKLGFGFENGAIEVPVLRTDIETKEDLAEEVIRVFGLNKLKAEAPRPVVSLPSQDDIFFTKDYLRSALTGLGYDEVYSHSFVGYGSDGSVEVKNYISEEKQFLRRRLLSQTLENVKSNLRFFNEVRLFEIGRVFEWSDEKIKEKNLLGVGISLEDEESGFLELKGVVDELLKNLNILNHSYNLADSEKELTIVINDSAVGRLVHRDENISLAEINIDRVFEFSNFEIEFKPLPKYPAVVRDISLVVGDKVKIGDIISEVQSVDIHLIRDIHLIDEYFPEEESVQSITFRIKFRSDEKTLSTEEVNKKMKKIMELVEKKFGAEVR